MAPFIPGKVNAKRRHAAMQAALFYARKNRVQKLSGPSFAGTTWNIADKNAGMTLSGDFLTVTGASGNMGIRAIKSLGAGKVYLEYSNILSGGASGNYGFGSADTGLSTNGSDWFGLGPSGNFQGNSIIGGGMATGTDGHTLGMAVDIDNGFWWTTYDGINWNNVAGADPHTGAHPVGINSGGAKPYFPFVFLQNGGHCTINAGSSAFAFSVPTGFKAWGK